LAISLDVANAFNSFPWSIIREALEDKGVSLYLRRVLDSYLSDRWLWYVGRGGAFKSVRVTCGVSQGSVLGPTLWNIAYDAVLRVDLPPGGEVLGYADDTLILVEGDSLSEVIRLGDICVSIVVGEIKRRGLRVSPP